MIDVDDALAHLPHFDRFCSLADLLALVETLRSDPRFRVMTAGVSRDGVPIHQITYGSGSITALVVGFPHCKEPICGMTVFGLLELLRQGIPTLDSGITWHVVPCIDPDGALLNEAWSQRPFSLENYMRNFYVQAPRDQVDMSFPVSHKKLLWNQPSAEATVLKTILDRVRPDFFYSLHNAWTGGAAYYLSHDIDQRYYDALYALLRRHEFPLQTRPIWKEVCRQFGDGIVEIWSVKRHYDHLEAITPEPQELLSFGAASWDYLSEIKPGALTLLTEMGYVRHPLDESEREVSGHLRKLKLRTDADGKFLGTLLLEEWDKVRQDVDTSNPIFRAILGGGVLPSKDGLVEGGRPLSLHPTADILFNREHNKIMTESDVFQAIMVDGGFWGLCQTYQFVRLLKASRPTTPVIHAIARLESAYADALADIDRYVHLKAASVISCDTLARIQLGSGLTVLNSLLAGQ